MNQAYVFLLLSICSLSCFGSGEKGRKSTFAEKDLFQNSCFLKNVPGLIEDYHGQPIRYFADHDGVVVYLTDAGPVYRLVRADEKKIREQERVNENDRSKHREEEEDGKGIPAVISYAAVKWIGANPHPRIEASGKASGYYTYLSDHTGSDIHTIMTEGFGKLVYRDLYPGIDVEYSFPDKGGMEYNLIVHPGADVSAVQMDYGGAVKKISLDAEGNIRMHTPSGDILEHAPVSSSNGNPVRSDFSVRGLVVRFALPDGYDHSQTLVIDPWVNVLTQIAIRNLGTSVDYDVAGDLFVYGAGGSDPSDTTYFQKVAKFDPSGNCLWIFMGSVPSAQWNTASTYSGVIVNLLSNAKVDRVANKVYVGDAFNAISGTQLVRLNSAGVYDNFISVANQSFEEIWSFVSDCSTGTVLALGGGLNSDLNMGVIDPVSGIVSTSNFTTITSPYQQDIVSGTYDAYGSLYVVMASVATNDVNNYIFKVNSTYNNFVWQVPSGYNTFVEGFTVPAFNSYNGDNTNDFNALAANGSYLFYYDGLNLKAFDLNTGAAVGTPVTLPNYNAEWQAGIAADNCNNIYLGGQGVINTYSFNGTTFTPGTNIPLGAAFSNDTVMDIRYNSSNNLLYVTGTAIAGTYAAPQSANCTVVNTLSASVSSDCGEATVVVTPGAGLTDAVFSFLWQDSAGVTIRQTTPDTLLIDTLSGLTPGQYTVQVQLNVNCGGSTVIDTFRIVCNNLIHSDDTTVCTGQSVVLSATGTPPGGTYTWTPGGSGPSITVNPSATTTYHVTYNPPSGAAITDSIVVTVVNNVTISVTDTVLICPGQSATLNASPSIGGGTYTWSPGNEHTQGITVSPTSSTMYTVTYSTAGCGTAVDSGLVLIRTSPGLSVTNATICAGGLAILTASSPVAGGTYSWAPAGNNDNTDTLMVSPTTTSTYTVTYSTTNCGTSIDSGTVTVTPGATLSVSNDTICSGQDATITATPSISGGSYSWSPAATDTPTITVDPLTRTTYTVTYSISGCVNVIDSGTVFVYPSPSVQVTTSNSQCSNNDGEAASMVTGGTMPYAYLWSDSAHSTTDSIGGLSPNTTYTVTVTDHNQCSATASGTVGVNDFSLSVVVDSLANISCYGAQNGIIAVHVPNCDDCTYKWSNQQTGDSLTGLAPGVYSLTATNPSGCMDTASYTIVQPPAPTLNIIPADTSIVEDTMVIFKPVFGPFPASSIVSYQWEPANGLSCSDCAEPSFSYGPGKYQYVLVIDYNQGCVISDTVNVSVFSQHLIYVPNSFSPNGNGVNDVFYIFPINAKLVDLQIFDRWGEKVFESQDAQIGWDGRFKGVMQDPGIFVYIVDVTFDDGYTVHNKGSITLIR